MKRILLGCLLLGSLVPGKAQTIPNGDFESWLFRGSFYDPEYWFTYNGDLENGGISPNVTRDTGAHSGTYAISLKTVAVPGGMVPGYTTLETELALKPSSINGWFKYQGTDDTGFIYSRIFRRTGGQVHMIYEGFFPFTGNTDTFKSFSMPYYKQPNGDETPDSCYIYLFSGKKENSELILDDLTFGPLLSVKEPVLNAVKVKVYPNPAADKAFVSLDMQKAGTVSVSLVNTSGVEVLAAQDYSFGTGAHTISLPLHGLPSGVYMLRIQSNSESHTLPLLIEP